MKYNSIIIGFGKGGKTLVADLAKSGEKVALIENQLKCMAEPASMLDVFHLNLW